MRLLTSTLSICALAAAFTAGALTAAPRSQPTPPAPQAAVAAEPVITISAMAFAPIAVAPGAVVRVINVDSVPHTVTAEDGAFDVFVDAGGEATFVAPPDAGTYAFFCAVHPAMAGSLTVT